MEIRRFGDALLKSSPSPLCFLLQLPSFSRSLQYVQKSPYITLSSHYHPRRKFSTRSTLHQNSSASAGAHAPESSDHNGVSSWSSSSTGSSSAEQTEIRIKGLLDETLSDGPVRHGLSQPPNSQIKSCVTLCGFSFNPTYGVLGSFSRGAEAFKHGKGNCSDASTMSFQNPLYVPLGLSNLDLVWDDR